MAMVESQLGSVAEVQEQWKEYEEKDRVILLVFEEWYEKEKSRKETCKGKWL